MKNKTAEPLELAHYINKFLSEYAPSHLTNSDNTLDSYGTALTLYMGYLETQRGITPDKFSPECFDQQHIEGWLEWLSGERKCGAGSVPKNSSSQKWGMACVMEMLSIVEQC